MSVTDRADRAGVEPGRHIERHERDESEIDSAVTGEGDRLVEQRVGSRPGADGDRDAREDVIVLQGGADGSQRHRDGGRVQQLRRDASESVPTEDAAARGADHDHAGSELLTGGDEPSANDSEKRT